MTEQEMTIARFGIKDDAFIRGDAPMTKAEVRAVLASKLRVQPGNICWDIGAGTGSVSVEMAMAAGPQGQLYAIEREEAALELIRANGEKFAVELNIIAGVAPQACADLPAPDRVFIGGSGGNLAEAIEFAALKLRPGGIMAADFILLNNIEKGYQAMEKAGLSGLGVVMVGITPISIISGGRMMLRQATPVFILWGEKPA